MKSLKENVIRILVIVTITGGLLYASFNVIRERFQGGERQRQIDAVTEPIMAEMEKSGRLECQSTVYLRLEEGTKEDLSQKVQMIHDFKHQRIQYMKGNMKEIQEYKNDTPVIYSKGISPVYIKESAELKRVSGDKWFEYPCEKMYGSERRSGKNEMISYGYLTSEEHIRSIEAEGKEEIDGKMCVRYKAVIKNTLRTPDNASEGNNEFRKALGAYGLDPMNLKKEYPEVYKHMKNIYDKDSEELYFWVDEGGKLVRIEKDYTFLYYLGIMKENSEKIQEQAGRYNYPQVICRQNYKYGPTCPNIDLPKDYEEL